MTLFRAGTGSNLSPSWSSVAGCAPPFFFFFCESRALLFISHKHMNYSPVVESEIEI
jgi:hypothetical protein